MTTASYEARAQGVKTAMPLAKALHLCPKMTVVPSNYPLYHKLSHQIHAFMIAHIPQVEQYSIDEFFADLSGWKKDNEVYGFAKELQSKILNYFDIPVSIGIAKAKWIAKLATESAKPYGVFEVKDIEHYIENIPIQDFPGIGKSFQKRLRKHHISTLGDVKKHKSLFFSWNKPGMQLYKRITGTCGEGISIKSARKSIGISRTFDTLHDVNEVRRRIMIMARHIAYMTMLMKVNPTTFYLKINYEYGVKCRQNITVNKVFSEYLLKKTLSLMYKALVLHGKGAIKLSLNVSNFTSQHKKTLSLIHLQEDMRQNRLSKVIHILRERFGLDIIKTGNEL